jgi:hypothetical protein
MNVILLCLYAYCNCHSVEFHFPRCHCYFLNINLLNASIWNYMLLNVSLSIVILLNGVAPLKQPRSIGAWERLSTTDLHFEIACYAKTTLPKTAGLSVQEG